MSKIDKTRPVPSGFPAIDGEHHLQLDLLSALTNAVAQDVGKAGVDEVLDRLIDFTKVHFQSEQLLMRLYDYPHYAAHLAEHEQTLEQMEALRDSYAGGDQSAATDACDTLTEWITGHIRGTDRALGQFLERMGATVA